MDRFSRTEPITLLPGGRRYGAGMVTSLHSPHSYQLLPEPTAPIIAALFTIDVQAAFRFNLPLVGSTSGNREEAGFARNAAEQMLPYCCNHITILSTVEGDPSVKIKGHTTGWDEQKNTGI